MITKVQKVHKMVVDLLNLSFSKRISFFVGCEDKYQVSKGQGDENIFNTLALHNGFKKIETPTT